ncbi:MAG TPA: hypothetical protein VKA21_01770 [Candidatus Binatia bacterium]|nr:hypothetical protein [Candidatus Binatia bacterium]
MYALVAVVLAAARVLGSSVPVETLVAKSRSNIEIGAFRVFLFAADETSGAVRGTYCGGDDGAAEHEGSYRLIVARGSEIVGSFDLGRKRFVEGRQHDGIRAVTLPGSGDRLLAIYQYGSCNTEDLELFRVTAGGKVARALFEDRQGSVRPAIGTSNADIPFDRDGRAVFCDHQPSYLPEYLFCDAWRWTGDRLVHADEWMPANLPASEEGPVVPTPRARATTALYRFLRNLDEPVGAGMYAGPGGSAAVVAHCARGGCPGLFDMRDGDSPTPGTWLFEAMFATGDVGFGEWDIVEVDGRKWWPFRVVQRGGGFAILDLPPLPKRAAAAAEPPAAR